MVGEEDGEPVHCSLDSLSSWKKPSFDSERRFTKIMYGRVGKVGIKIFILPFMILK